VGAVLVISQLTLPADCRKGNRPLFENAENPLKAKEISAIYRRAAKNGAYHGGRRFQGLYGGPPHERRPGHHDAGFKEIRTFKTFKTIDILAVID